MNSKEREVCDVCGNIIEKHDWKEHQFEQILRQVLRTKSRINEDGKICICINDLSEYGYSDETITNYFDNHEWQCTCRDFKGSRAYEIPATLLNKYCDGKLLPNGGRIATVLAVDPHYVWVLCPYCGKIHRHGSLRNIKKDHYGNRVGHCLESVSYDLVCDQYTARRSRRFSYRTALKAYNAKKRAAIS
jgi:predicted RNA-binding Zn-ribbon protein involved in translation (DUF1610 family)